MILGLIESKVTPEQNGFLNKTFEAQEIRDTIFSMHPDKAPGSDRMNLGF